MNLNHKCYCNTKTNFISVDEIKRAMLHRWNQLAVCSTIILAEHSGRFRVLKGPTIEYLGPSLEDAVNTYNQLVS